MKRKFLYFAFFVVFLLLFINSLSSCALKSAAEDTIYAKINEKGALIISASFSDESSGSFTGGRLYLFELTSCESENDLDLTTPVMSKRFSRSLSFSLPLERGATSRLYNRFLIAEYKNGKYIPVSGSVYISNPEALASSSSPYPQPYSKKGLIAPDCPAAFALGASQVILNLDFDSFISTSVQSEDTTSCVFNGVTYYIAKAPLKLLDHRVRVYSDAGVLVYLNITFASLPEGSAALNRYTALMEFLSSRYNPGSQYGFAASYIIGAKLNEAEGTDTAQRVKTAAELVRIASTASRSHYSRSRVFAAVSGLYIDADTNGEPLFGAKNFISLVSASLGELYYGWYINATPPAGLWNDENARNTGDTPYITPANLEIFLDFLSSEALLYKGEARPVVFSLTAAGQTLSNDRQAAFCIYSYFKACFYNPVAAFMYDGVSDGSLYGEDRENLSVFNAFRFMDTGSAAEECSFALGIIGISKWGTLFSDFTYDAVIARRTRADLLCVSKDKIPKRVRSLPLFDFSQGYLNGFYPSDNANYIEPSTNGETGKAVLKASLKTGNAGEVSGFSKTFSKSETDFAKASYLVLRLKTEASDTQPVSVTLALYSTLDKTDADKTLLCSSAGTAVTCGEWTNVYIELANLPDNIDDKIMMKLYVTPLPSAKPGDEFIVLMDSVSLIFNKMPFYVLLLIISASALGLFGALIAAAYILGRIRLARKKRIKRALLALNENDNIKKSAKTKPLTDKNGANKKRL